METDSSARRTTRCDPRCPRHAIAPLPRRAPHGPAPLGCARRGKCRQRHAPLAGQPFRVECVTREHRKEADSLAKPFDTVPTEVPDRHVVPPVHTAHETTTPRDQLATVADDLAVQL